MAYSKAYKIKNRIIEVIEKYETYDNYVYNGSQPRKSVQELLDEDLRKSGYIVATPGQVSSKCGTIPGNLNTSGYLYCVYLKSGTATSERIYEVVTYIHFDFPVIGKLLTFEVHGETKMLGKNYNY